MEIVNQIGHIQYWGLSPACNLLQHHKDSEEKPVKVLMSGCSDIRHLLKTICDISKEGRKYSKVEFYFH